VNIGRFGKLSFSLGRRDLWLSKKLYFLMEGVNIGRFGKLSFSLGSVDLGRCKNL
jgi:hypothetical protein